MNASRLKSFGPGLWLADGSETEVIGFRCPTRMAVVRLSSGDLLIWSPVALSERLTDEVNALGPVRHLVAPNSLHHLFLAEWVQAYPQATLHGAPGLDLRRRDLTIHETLVDAPPAAWSGELDQVIFRGNKITTDVVFFHRPSATALFTDLIQQFPPRWFSGWRALVARLDLMVAAEPSVPRKFRLAFSDRVAARAALTRILDWPATRVVMAHGAPVTQDGQAFLARAFRWLTR